VQPLITNPEATAKTPRKQLFFFINNLISIHLIDIREGDFIQRIMTAIKPLKPRNCPNYTRSVWTAVARHRFQLEWPVRLSYTPTDGVPPTGSNHE
jgi:hypothetical protein